ncbi:thiosulfate sulfurtransferase/rhodanese-like domain-containing protein 2 isoform X2 [Salminus brasiliensis]|uniref:thiosulfate sulfurtransferase/rhodanese-like domain-containing protein 2 isoform X2 n=1 Tax=Salminus brasiliensis TaxID=930266 RepID=UPI003B838B62
MDSGGLAESVLVHLDVEGLTPGTPKHEKPEISTSRKCYSYMKKRTFATFVASKRVSRSPSDTSPLWRCCDKTFSDPSSIHKHVSNLHADEIEQLTTVALELMLSQSEGASPDQKDLNESQLEDASSWIPSTSHLSEKELSKGPGEVLLYYCYCQIQDPKLICYWQSELCSKLHLTGKVRVATEGINGTVGGTKTATKLYIKAMLSHPIFKVMQVTDFKVGVYKEIVPMGVDPDIISYRLAGTHLEPEEFHKAVQSLLEDASSKSDTILLDCRNFYESKIGQFRNCLAPDIRKFSYFPDYVEKNLDLFRNKKVLMYCTGGIRCERGSAYLRSKNICKEVYQLKGGIHKYLEQFPEGFYRGKLFVFDDRYAISFNNDIISDCRYCGDPWDQYQLCSTDFCCQLVLSCTSCRQKGLTACCPVCQAKEQAPNYSPSHGHPHREECECTDSRPRIPKDSL